jgi:SRSO17 transposase
VHASPAEVPEVQEFFARFQVRFRRPEGRAALERYTTGLLTELPNKHGDTIAAGVPGTGAQRLQAFLTKRQGEEEDLNRQRVQKMMAEATRGDGVLVVDDTGFPKQGRAAVGVERRYSGTLGNVGHCQIAVTCCDTDRQATWPVGVRLSLPKTWAHGPERRPPARGPATSPFQTKPEIALALLDQARAWGGPHRCVVADADDGDNPNFLAGWEARQESSVVGVRPDFAVSLRNAATSRAWRADARRETGPRWPWRLMRWRKGTHGWRRQKCVALRGWRVTSGEQRHEGWLLGERAARGQPEERKYFWSTLPAEASLEALVGYAHRRHAIEPFHEEAKGALGWDQDQGRLWPGFHRHAVTVMLAYSFLVWLALRERRRRPRQGCPRDPFSPSAEAPASDPSGGASGDGPVAPAPGGSVVGDDGSVHRTRLI